MRKYGIVAEIYKKNTYGKLSKATHEHRTVPNPLNRQFDHNEPRNVFVTDITYLLIRNGQNIYLSHVKDAETREIVAQHMSTSLHMDIVFETMKKLEEH